MITGSSTLTGKIIKKKRFVKFAIAAIVAVVACIGFTGCMDDIKDVYKGKTPEEPNTFSFSTKKTVEFALKYDVPAGYYVHFEMYSKSPITLDEYKSYVKDTTLVPFLSGRSQPGGKISFKGELPATVNEIYAYSSAIGVPVLMKASVSDAGIVSDFKVAEVPKVAKTRGASGTISWDTYNVTLNRPNLTPTSIEIEESDLILIDKSFPVSQSYGGTNTYYRPGIAFTEDATVKIYSVSHAQNSDRINALAYFTYPTADYNKIDAKNVNSNLNLVFPKLTKTEPAQGFGYQLVDGGSVTFKKGTSISFALFPDIKNEVAATNTHLLYSCFTDGTSTSWNAYKFSGLIRANAPHMVLSLLRKTNNGHAIIAISFEDQPWSNTHGDNKGDFRDDIFILEIDPASSLPDLPIPPEKEPEYDEEFKTSGILCFEDSWPEKGDYDLNDVVVAYERGFCFSYKSGLVALKEKYTFLNNGATFVNGFGYQLLGLQTGNIQKCTVTSTPNYDIEGQGLDKSMTDAATIMLFDNARSLANKTSFVVYTSFSNGGEYLNNNPFIVVKRHGESDNFLSQGRREIHLATSTKAAQYKFLPTMKADVALWGTEDDCSMPGDKIYYVRSGYYPFAFDINWDSSKYGPPTQFVIPEEKLSIENTYPRFVSWAESNGTKDKDWYLHPNK